MYRFESMTRPCVIAELVLAHAAPFGRLTQLLEAKISRDGGERVGEQPIS
jgi:hypothetical protein